MKRLITIVLLAALGGCLIDGCTLPGPLARLGNFADHCALVRGETGWANVSFQCFFEDNPLDTAPLQIP